ncbi:MAG: MFS transporter [Calothrix sp. FI2-JRJ7]|nr:MFS transporter [Calothrix sp. FI2-JRJ7]
MRVFIIIWFGQLVSLIGSNLTNFALGLWVYQHTGAITQFAFISLSMSVPLIVISPFAGALVDRWNHRDCMIFSDFSAGLNILAIALLLLIGRLEIWHIYLAVAISSTLQIFQGLAYVATTTVLVSKHNLSRANGMHQLAGAITQLISPMLGGVLLEIIHLHGIILLDFTTFIFSLITLLVVRFPSVKINTKKAGKSLLFREIAYAWTYITARKGLLGLMIFFTTNSFFIGTFSVLFTPLVLSLTSPTVLGIIVSIGGIGSLAGSLLMSTWGNSKQLIYNLLGFQMLGGLCLIFVGLHINILLLTFFLFLFFFGLPIFYGCNQAICQKIIPPDLQGRVFAIKQMLANSSRLFAYLIAGLLAEKVFKPLVLPHSPLAASIGQIIRTGTGNGIGLMFIFIGFLTMLVSILGYQYPPLRSVEDESPHDLLLEK